MKCGCGIELTKENSHTTWEKGWKERICHGCGAGGCESMTMDDFMRNSPVISEDDRLEYVKANPLPWWWV